jgi:SSS family transporter
MHGSINAVDLVIVFGYLAALAGVGVYFSRRHQNLDEFLIAGRTMTWLPVGLSLMAALNSGIDYLTQPSATIRYGIVLVVGTVSWLVLYPWVARVVFPFYHRLDFYSAYEYLEQRFDLRVRTLAASIFVLWRLGWMATALYVPCLAIDAATSGAFDLETMIVVLGVLVTFYTMLGGIKAVIWNDVIQFCVMFAGLAATVLIVLAHVPGGVAEVWSVSAAANKTAWWVPFELGRFFTEPVTVPAMLFALVVGRAAQYTSDQVMVQRLQTTRSIGDARRAFVVNATGDAMWMVGLSFVGLALFAYFTRTPLPDGFDTDRILPYFMAREFPAGAVGLVIAAILAASLSSIDSAIHSCSSVVVVDGYNRLWLGQQLVRGAVAPADQQMQVKVSRAATVVVGAAGTALAINVSSIGTLLEIANKLINALTGPLLGIYLVAMFSRRIGGTAALLGGLAGAVASYVTAYHSSLSFYWPSTMGLAATLATSVIVSAVLGERPTQRQLALTWKSVMSRPHGTQETADTLASS